MLRTSTQIIMSQLRGVCDVTVVRELWPGTLREGFSEVPRTLLLAIYLNADLSGGAVFHRTKIKTDGPNRVRDMEYIWH